ncbi:MAG: hypothetical protein ABIS67_09260 [Candidatus Eisenbacteria bacterium]
MADGKRTCAAGRSLDRIVSIVVLLLVVALVVPMSGCSLIGLGIGAGVEASRSKAPVHLSSERAAYLQTGSLLTLVMTDSSTITGVVLDPQFPAGVDSRQTGVRLAHLSAEHPAIFDTLLVPFEQVAYARSPRLRHAARNGFRVGLKMDMVVLGLVGISVLLALLFFLMLSQSGFSLG